MVMHSHTARLVGSSLFRMFRFFCCCTHFIFFGCQLLGYVFRPVRPSVSYNNAKRTIPVREKQQKHLQSLAKTMKRINQTNSKKKILRGRCVRDERAVPESSNQWCTKRKEDRRREAIGFEIPVTRGAFDQREGSIDDIKYHKTINNTGRKVL